MFVERVVLSGNIHKFMKENKKNENILFKNYIITDIYSMSSNYSSEILSDKDIKKLLSEQKKISMPFLTKYEKARLLGIRIKQLTSGSLPLIDTTGFTNFIDIAEEELKQKKTPLIIKRRMPNNKYEYWRISDLIQLD